MHTQNLPLNIALLLSDTSPTKNVTKSFKNHFQFMGNTIKIIKTLLDPGGLINFFEF